MEKLKRVDYIGNATFVSSVVSILLSLTWAGTTYPWSSHQVLLPLISGFVGLAAFLYYESSIYCHEPTMPPHFFKNRTTAAALGVSRPTMSRWLRQWRTKGIGSGPRPIFLGPNGRPPVRFCIDDIVIPSETMPCFLDRMRKRLADDIAAEQTKATAAKGSI